MKKEKEIWSVVNIKNVKTNMYEVSNRISYKDISEKYNWWKK